MGVCRCHAGPYVVTHTLCDGKNTHQSVLELSSIQPGLIWGTSWLPCIWHAWQCLHVSLGDRVEIESRFTLPVCSIEYKTSTLVDAVPGFSADCPVMVSRSMLASTRLCTNHYHGIQDKSMLLSTKLINSNLEAITYMRASYQHVRATCGTD